MSYTHTIHGMDNSYTVMYSYQLECFAVCWREGMGGAYNVFETMSAAHEYAYNKAFPF